MIGGFLKIVFSIGWFSMNLQFSITICLSFFTARWYVVTKGNSNSLLNNYELTMMTLKGETFAGFEIQR